MTLQEILLQGMKACQMFSKHQCAYYDMRAITYVQDFLYKILSHLIENMI